MRAQRMGIGKLVRNLIHAVTKPIMLWEPARQLYGRVCRRGCIPQRVKWSLPLLPRETSIRLDPPHGSALTYCCVPGDSVGQCLFLDGCDGFERETVHVFGALAARARRVLDIGAYTGIYSLLACAASATSKVTAFEPVASNREALRRNIELNGWQQRTEIVGCAVSSANGRAILSARKGEGVLPTGATLEKSLGPRQDHYWTREVETVTIDASIARCEPVDLVKIDVEGHQAEVLRGMIQTLNTWVPAIVVECNPDERDLPLDTLLPGGRYSIYHLRDSGPVAVDGLVPDPNCRFRNFLLWPGTAPELNVVLRASALA